MYALVGWSAVNLGWSAILVHESKEQDKKLKKQKTYQVHALLRAMKGVIWLPGEERTLDQKLKKLDEAKARWGALDEEIQEIEETLKRLDLQRVRYGLLDIDNNSERWIEAHRSLIEHIVNESEHIDKLTELLPELLEGV